VGASGMTETKYATAESLRSSRYGRASGSLGVPPHELLRNWTDRARKTAKSLRAELYAHLRHPGRPRESRDPGMKKRRVRCPWVPDRASRLRDDGGGGGRARSGGARGCFPERRLAKREAPK